MPDQHVLDRIDRWRAAGLIDDPTAERLRSAEADEPGGGPVREAAAASATGLPGAIGSMFGPTPIAELFAYLGARFVIVAWHVLVASWRQPVYDSGLDGPAVDYLRIALEWGLPAVALAVAGWLLLGRDDRSRRATGVAFAVATLHVYGGVGQAFQGGDYLLAAVAASVASVAAAILFRVRQPGMVTQLVLLVTIVSLSTSALASVGHALFGELDYGFDGTLVNGNLVTRQLLQLAWWLGTAVLLGLVARREIAAARAVAFEPVVGVAAARRAALTQFAAGLTAVGGTATAVLAGGFADQGLPTIAGDGVVLVVGAVLLVFAARTASIYLYPMAALGIIIALTSLNATYVAQQTGIGVAFLSRARSSSLPGCSPIACGARSREAARVHPPHSSSPMEPRSPRVRRRPSPRSRPRDGGGWGARRCPAASPCRHAGGPTEPARHRRVRRSVHDAARHRSRRSPSARRGRGPALDRRAVERHAPRLAVRRAGRRRRRPPAAGELDGGLPEHERDRAGRGCRRRDGDHRGQLPGRSVDRPPGAARTRRVPRGLAGLQPPRPPDGGVAAPRRCHPEPPPARRLCRCHREPPPARRPINS